MVIRSIKHFTCASVKALKFEVMQPGRTFLRSLQTTFLMHIKGKVHDENGSFRLQRRSKALRCTRPERVDSYPRTGPLERSDIANRVLAVVKACPSVDSSKVEEYANFEEDLKLEKGDVVLLVLSVLKKYDLVLSYVEARKMTTCAQVIDYIESQVCPEYASSNDEE